MGEERGGKTSTRDKSYNALQILRGPTRPVDRSRWNRAGHRPAVVHEEGKDKNEKYSCYQIVYRCTSLRFTHPRDSICDR